MPEADYIWGVPGVWAEAIVHSRAVLVHVDRVAENSSRAHRASRGFERSPACTIMPSIRAIPEAQSSSMNAACLGLVWLPTCNP